VAQFIANHAFLQLAHNEYLDLHPASNRVMNLRLTSSSLHPQLTYVYWPEDVVWSPELPRVQVIVELRGFQVREATRDGAWSDDWELVQIDDPRVSVLKPLFLGAAHYWPLHANAKRTYEQAA
jgi:hypothetical protein